MYAMRSENIMLAKTFMVYGTCPNNYPRQGTLCTVGTTSIIAALYYQANEILIGRTNREDALYELARYEGALLL